MRSELIALAVVCGALGQATAVRAAGFSLVFSEDFNGSALDRDKWATRYVYADGTQDHLNDEQQRFADDGNQVVEGGTLSLVAKVLGNGHYSSGMIRSRQTFYYGYYEARVFLPGARGVWPAFWLNSDYDADGRLAWPPEIDVFEYVINGGTEHSNMLHSGMVVGSKGNRGGEWLYRDPSFNQQWTYYGASGPLNTAWQVVGLLWKPDSVSFYLNGKKLYTRAYHWTYDDGMQAGPAHLLFNLAIGGAWAGVNGVEEARFPQAFKVDYVRVCQYTPSGVESLCPGTWYSPLAEAAAYTAEAGDLKRTRLISATLSKTTLAPGASLTVSYELDATPTRNAHQLRTTLVNRSGATVAEIAAAPPTATSAWRGRQRVSQSLTVPKTLAAGDYDVLMSVGSFPSWGERRIPLAADEAFGVADGKLRYEVGSIRVAK
jgi:beta-glucanase (GH16 family)